MTTAPSKLIVIPPVKDTPQAQAAKKKLRVAAYCRVSTDDEEQLTSYEAQKSYYTDKITGNPDWIMADIFADEGKTGTSISSRKDFQRLIRQCRRGKIDLILTKSLSRFARNTLDTVKYTRELRQLGIPVIFEKENLNSISWESEFLLTLYGAFAQSESESISKNVSWGKRQAMKDGRVVIQYKHLLGYIRGENGKPEIVPEQAETIRFIFKRYLAGDTLRAIKAQLEAEQVPYITGEVAWNISTLQSILQNEKYCGDVIMQKTFRKDYYTDIYFKGEYNKAAMRYLEDHGLAPVIQDGDMELIREGTSDFLALNYYASECAKWCPEGEGKEIRYSGVNRSGKKGDISGFETHPGFYEMCKNPNLDTTDWDWAIDPVGMEYMLRDLYNRYGKPLMITENGLGAYDELTSDGKVHDDYRIDYLRGHIQAVKRAMDKGVEMIAYCPWSAVDLLSTSNGMKKRYGLIYVDRTDDDPKDCARIRKDSFYWYQKAIASNGADLA